MQNRVSVIVPAFNGVDTITRAIESVLGQRYPAAEICVVDDGSTDATVEIVQRHFSAVRLIQQPNAGTLAARQTGLNAAQGELIAFLDQDDVWYPDLLEAELSVLQQHPEAGLVCANMRAVDDHGTPLGFNVVPEGKCHSPSRDELLLLHPIANSAALFRRDVLSGIGGLDPSFGHSGALGDTDTFVRVAGVSAVHYLDKCLGDYRWSEARPGRLISFLTNLQVYARKYWQEPFLLEPKAAGTRQGFLLTCSNYALHIFRLMLTQQYGGRAPQELLARLNVHHTAMREIFGEAYASGVGLQPVDLNTIGQADDALRTALFVYLLRPDLQRSFPDVLNGNLTDYLAWAAAVAAVETPDSDVKLLRPFASDLEQMASSLDATAGRPTRTGVSPVNRMRARLFLGLSTKANQLFPQGSRRRRVLRPLLRGIRSILAGDWTGFVRQTKGFIAKYARIALRRSASAGRPGAASRNLGIAEAKLEALLSSQASKMSFPAFENPEVAIVATVHGSLLQAYECLENLAAHSSAPYRMFVAPQESADEVAALLSKLDNTTILESAAQSAQRLCDSLLDRLRAEKYILFVSDEVVVTPGYLRHMQASLESDKHCGAVTCKIMDLAGSLVEAGRIRWQNGTRSSYGAGDVADKPEYSFVRQVALGSDKCMLVRREILEHVAAKDSQSPLDELIGDVSYENGFSIIYQPAAIGLQRAAFNPGQRLHKTALELQAGGRAGSKARILVIDEYIPAVRYGAGFPRAYEMLNCLAELGYAVTFLPVANPVKAQPETSQLQQKGVEVMWGEYANLEDFGRERPGLYDLVFISRPHVFERISPAIRGYFPNTALVYDAEALFHTRDILKAKTDGVEISSEQKDDMIRAEMKLMEAADLVISVSENTKQTMLRNNSQQHIEVWEHIRDIQEANVPFERREDILFFGSFFAGPGSPNEDAVLYFAREVLPRILRQIRCRFHIVGTDPTPAVRQLAQPAIEVAGYVEDLVGYANRSRVNVVPTRFAAGIALKLLEAMGYGIPSVVSSLVAGQLGLIDRRQVLVADSPEEFAQKVVELYTNAELWSAIQQNGMKYIKDNFSRAHMREKLNFIVEKGLEIRDSRRQPGT